jgi:CubicO group peptidase (beta-lactamase class C family)
VLDSIFAAYGGDVPGASVAVVCDGNVVLESALGLANVEDRTPATPSTNYRLASVSKQFTATAALVLVDDGKLSLDEPVRAKLPRFPKCAARVTPRHLLTHTSGLCAYESLIHGGRTDQLTDRDVLDLVCGHDRLYFEPGTQFRYSNTGFAILALLVEEISGLSFPRFLGQRIFAPLGMSGTIVPEWGRTAPANRAFGYSRCGAGFTRTDQSPTSAVMGDGGIYSSVLDLARWDASRVLSESTARAATTPHMLANGVTTSYGFGWFVDTHRGRRRARHSGSSIGFQNAVLRYPDERLTVIVLTNRSDGDPPSMADGIAEAYLSQ